MASPFVPCPSHTSGEPPTRARLCWSIRSNPKRLLPGPVGGASAPVPSTETPVAPEMSAPIDPEGADFERRELPPLQAAPIKPTPMASRNCLRVGCKRGPGPCRDISSLRQTTLHLQPAMPGPLLRDHPKLHKSLNAGIERPVIERHELSLEPVDARRYLEVLGQAVAHQDQRAIEEEVDVALIGHEPGGRE